MSNIIQLLNKPEMEPVYKNSRPTEFKLFTIDDFMIELDKLGDDVLESEIKSIGKISNIQLSKLTFYLFSRNKYRLLKFISRDRNEIKEYIKSPYSSTVCLDGELYPYEMIRFLYKNNISELDEFIETAHIKWWVDDVPPPSTKLPPIFKFKDSCINSIGKKLIEVWFNPDCMGGINAKRELLSFVLRR